MSMKGLIILTIALVIFGVVAYEASAAYHENKGRPTCASFASYEDARRALAAGDTGLDRDHDGCPCEQQFHHPCGPTTYGG